MNDATSCFCIKPYTPADRQAWDEFVRQSKNGTFLFLRDYMDYHSDRFEDASLMVFYKGKLYALFPGNRKDNVFYSHQGLTYGGLLTDRKATAAAVVALFSEINNWLRCQGFVKVVYKAIPWIYHRLPAEEDLYAIFRTCNARLVARDVSSTIMLDRRIKFIQSRHGGAVKARKLGLEVMETNDVESFWHILDNNLEHKYGVRPVHTVDELKLLKSRFPDFIRLFMTYSGDTALGGTLLYLMDQTVHTQYISASPEGKRHGALDLLFDHIINKEFANGEYRYFDFGKSTEDHGHILNDALIFQKEGFGGRGVCYDCYEWDL